MAFPGAYAGDFEPEDEWEVRPHAVPAAAPRRAFAKAGAFAARLEPLEDVDPTPRVPTSTKEPIGVQLVRGDAGNADDPDSWHIVVDGRRVDAPFDQGSVALPAPFSEASPIDWRRATVMNWNNTLLDDDADVANATPRPLVFGARLEGEARAPKLVEVVVEQVARSVGPSGNGQEQTVGLVRYPLTPHRSRDPAARASVLPYPYTASAQSALIILSFRELNKWATLDMRWQSQTERAKRKYEEKKQAYKKASDAVAAAQQVLASATAAVAAATQGNLAAAQAAVVAATKALKDATKELPKKKPDDEFKPTQRPSMPANRVHYYQIGGEKRAAIEELAALVGRIADASDKVFADRNRPNNAAPVWADADGWDALRWYTHSMRGGGISSSQASNLLELLAYGLPYPPTASTANLSGTAQEVEQRVGEGLVAIGKQMNDFLKETGPKKRREMVQLYEQLGRNTLRRATMGLRYSLHVVEHDGSEHTVFLRSLPIHEEVAHAAYTHVPKHVNAIKQAARRLSDNAARIRSTGAPNARTDRRNDGDGNSQIDRFGEVLKEIVDTALSQALPEWASGPAAGLSPTVGVDVYTRLAPQIVTFMRERMPHLQTVVMPTEVDVEVAIDTADVDGWWAWVRDLDGLNLIGMTGYTLRFAWGAASRTVNWTFSLVNPLAKGYARRLVLAALMAAGLTTGGYAYGAYLAAAAAAANVRYAAGTVATGASSLYNWLLGEADPEANDEDEEKKQEANHLAYKGKDANDPYDFLRWRLRALGSARHDLMAGALFGARAARAGVGYSSLGTAAGSKARDGTLRVLRADETRYRFAEHWKVTPNAPAPPPAAEPMAWDAQPNAGLLVAVPPPSVVAAVHDAVVLREVPIAHAVARVVGFGSEANPVGSAVQTAVQVAHGELEHRVRTKGASSVPLGERLLANVELASARAAERAAELLLAALGSKVPTEALPRADDGFWRCVPAADAARLAVRHLLTFDADGAWAHGAPAPEQRAVVDAFAREWTRQARASASAAVATSATKQGSHHSSRLANEARAVSSMFARMQALSNEADVLLAVVDTAPRVVAAVCTGADAQVMQLAGTPDAAAREAASKLLAHPPLAVARVAGADSWAARRLDLEPMRSLSIGAESVTRQLAGLALVDGGGGAPPLQHYYCPLGSVLAGRPGVDAFGVFAQTWRPVKLQALVHYAGVLLLDIDAAATRGDVPTAPGRDVAVVLNSTHAPGEKDAKRGLARHPAVIALHPPTSTSGARVDVQLALEGELSTSPVPKSTREPPVTLAMAARQLCADDEDGPAPTESLAVRELRARTRVRNVRELTYNADRYAQGLRLAAVAPVVAGPVCVTVPQPRHWPALALGLALIDTETGGSAPVVRPYSEHGAAPRGREALVALRDAAARALAQGYTAALLPELCAAVSRVA
jgi:hypothetical protein